ncbi:helix-turn-helix domain-containing protein [Chitinophaga deserti]|uniref:helix-turn-helix domain-containing protein n=1 Tax=Chitinophaga deserti TaxID=2164099 RepID=UPI000D6B7036|nr:helix-turn-helix transcriptional regulator [Chitinophaga deserti]
MEFNDLTVYKVKSHIAELSKTLRVVEGISQDQLAEQLNMSRNTIKNVEGAKNATLDTFLKVLQHFDLLEKFDDFIRDSIADKNVSSLY